MKNGSLLPSHDTAAISHDSTHIWLKSDAYWVYTRRLLSRLFVALEVDFKDTQRVMVALDGTCFPKPTLRTFYPLELFGECGSENGKQFL